MSVFNIHRLSSEKPSFSCFRAFLCSFLDLVQLLCQRPFRNFPMDQWQWKTPHLYLCVGTAAAQCKLCLPVTLSLSLAWCPWQRTQACMSFSAEQFYSLLALTLFAKQITFPLSWFPELWRQPGLWPMRIDSMCMHRWTRKDKEAHAHTQHQISLLLLLLDRLCRYI